MGDCVFCKIINGELPCMRVYEDGRTLAFMDVAGDVDGHIVVIPKAHCVSVLDCDEEALASLMRTVKIVSRHLVDDCGYDGVNLLNASGEGAGQSVPHLHFHIIPRKSGDGIDAWGKFDGAKQRIEEVFERVKM